MLLSGNTLYGTAGDGGGSGFGTVGGLCAAAALARVGVECEVFEQAEELREVGSGLTLWANAIQALRQLGIAETVLLTLPALTVLRSGTNVTVSWPLVNTADFVLEQAGTLSHAATWATNAASIADDGTHKSVTLPATNSSQFFRLRRP